MQTSYFFAIYTIVVYYTIIMAFRVQNPGSFAPSSRSFIFLFAPKMEKIKNSSKKRVPSKEKRSTTKKKISGHKNKPAPLKSRAATKYSLKKISVKLAFLKSPKKSQIIIITCITITSYLVGFSKETFLITYIYLCVIYLVTLIYFAYTETKEENEILKQRLTQQRKEQRKKKRHKPQSPATSAKSKRKQFPK